MSFVKSKKPKTTPKINRIKDEPPASKRPAEDPSTIKKVAFKTADRVESLVKANEFRNSLPAYQIDGVSFSFMGDELLKKLAPVTCTSNEFQGVHSINSSQMGTVDRDQTCGRCGLIDIECPGHIGKIDLAIPLPNPLAVDFIIYVLRSVCSSCGKLLLPECKKTDPSILRLKGVARLREISKIVSSSSESLVCPSWYDLTAGSIVRTNGKKSKEYMMFSDPDNKEVVGPFDPSLIHADGDDGTGEDGADGGEGGEDEATDYKRCPALNPKYCAPRDRDQWQIIATIDVDGISKVSRVSIEHVRKIFKNISPEDLSILGFSGQSHPSHFIMGSFPVIPERCRPPIERDGERKQDHITLVYMAIIRENNKLKDYLAQKKHHEMRNMPVSGALENQISATTRNLYFIVSHIINNTDGKLRLRLGDAASTLTDRISGKEGLCRATSQGKRVNFCARTVIGPALVPFGAILAPDVMRVLTIPEKVNRFNIARIRELVDDGKVVHITKNVGADRGIFRRIPRTPEGRVKAKLTGDSIEIGDMVERFGDTGDDWTINRQPTLHRHSMIGVYTIFKKNRYTFGLHCAYTTPMNADFDGRLNCHQQGA